MALGLLTPSNPTRSTCHKVTDGLARVLVFPACVAIPMGNLLLGVHCAEEAVAPLASLPLDVPLRPMPPEPLPPQPAKGAKGKDAGGKGKEAEAKQEAARKAVLEAAGRGLGTSESDPLPAGKRRASSGGMLAAAAAAAAAAVPGTGPEADWESEAPEGSTPRYDGDRLGPGPCVQQLVTCNRQTCLPATHAQTLCCKQSETKHTAIACPHTSCLSLCRATAMPDRRGAPAATARPPRPPLPAHASTGSLLGPFSAGSNARGAVSASTSALPSGAPSRSNLGTAPGATNLAASAPGGGSARSILTRHSYHGDSPAQGSSPVPSPALKPIRTSADRTRLGQESTTGAAAAAGGGGRASGTATPPTTPYTSSVFASAAALASALAASASDPEASLTQATLSAAARVAVSTSNSLLEAAAKVARQSAAGPSPLDLSPRGSISDADDVRLGDSDEDEEGAEHRQQRRRRGVGFAGNRDVAADEGADDEVGSQLSGMSYPIHVRGSDGSGAGGTSGGGGEGSLGGAAAEEQLMRRSLNAALGQEGKGESKEQGDRRGAQPLRRSGGRFGALLGAAGMVARGVGSAGGAGVRVVGALVAQAVLRPVVNAGERAAVTVAAEQQQQQRQQQQEDEQGQQEQPRFDAQGLEASPQGDAGGAGAQAGGHREVLTAEQGDDGLCDYADKEELD